MPASTQRSKRPIILLVTPHQIENKFLTQRHLPQINARIKVRRKKGEQPLELNATISNPFYKDEIGQEGGRLIKSKKLRKKLQQGSLALQAGAIGAAALGQPEAVAPLEAASLGAQALAGLGKKKTGKILRGIHEVSNASRGIETGGYGKGKKKPRYSLQNQQ
jgi:hypothetical protein